MTLNLFTIPLYYISFNKNLELEQKLKDIGFKYINHFKAIDGRELDVKKIVNDKIITIRSYNDLVYGREQHTGLPSLGAVGCTLSHRELWKLCIAKFPYIIIVEDDIDIKNLSKKDIDIIQNSLTLPNSVFISSRSSTGEELLFGTHFTIVSNNAAKKLYDNSIPISIQVDSYIGHMHNIGEINLTTHDIFTQKPHKSSIQDFCIKCNIPKNIYGCKLSYIILIISIICFIQLGLFYKIYIHRKVQ